MSETAIEPQAETEEEPVEPVEPVEPDTDDEEAEDEEPGQPEPEPEPERSPNDLALERIASAAEKKWANYGKGVLGLYDGTDAQLYECPLCPTQHKGFVDVRFAGMVPDDLAENVTAYLMGGAEPSYPQASDMKRCAHCDGWGKVKSGSRAAGKTAVTCSVCKGYGYTPPPGTSDPGYAAAAGLPESPNGDAGPLVEEDKDIWNSPRLLPDGQENPNYGKMPQYKDPALP